MSPPELVSATATDSLLDTSEATIFVVFSVRRDEGHRGVSRGSERSMFEGSTRYFLAWEMEGCKSRDMDGD